MGYVEALVSVVVSRAMSLCLEVRNDFVFVTFQLFGMQKTMGEAWLDWFCLLISLNLKQQRLKR